MKNRYVIGTILILALVVAKSYLDNYRDQRLISSVKCVNDKPQKP
jgi:hypothetical protein